MRGYIYSKSKTCIERLEVDVAGISVKVTESYPGRLDSLSLMLRTTASKYVWKGRQKLA